MNVLSGTGRHADRLGEVAGFWNFVGLKWKLIYRVGTKLRPKIGNFSLVKIFKILKKPSDVK